MSVFRVGNQIFSTEFSELKLTPNELYVFTYLCSVHSHNSTLLGDLIKVKQATIAQKCQLKTTETVSRIISSLMKKGLISSVVKTVKANHYRGTNSYIINIPSNKDGFFYVERQVFGQLSARQMRVYLFLAKSFNYKRNDSWNSYNDISRQLNISRQEAISMVDELLTLKFITKSLRKARNNRRVFVDNHYTIVGSVPGRIKAALKCLFAQDLLLQLELSARNFTLLWIFFSARLYRKSCERRNLKLPYT